jgi:hypothetical protein
LERKITHHVKMIKSSTWILSVLCHKINILLHRYFTFPKFWLSKCSPSSPLSIHMYLVFFEHLWTKLTQFETSSNQNRPTEIDYCSLLYIQFHYNECWTISLLNRKTVPVSAEMLKPHKAK